MKKKIIGLLLMGAFVVSSTSVFVSCKDYDGDVEELRTQIGQLSQLVNTKETTINSSITTLQTALTTLQNAQSTLSDNMTAGDAATLIAAQKAVEEAKSQLENAIKATNDAIKNNSDAIKTNSDAIKANSDAIKSATGDISDLATVNATQDKAIVAAQTSADQALAQLEQLIAAFTATSRGENAAQSLEGIQAAVAYIQQMKADLADLNNKYNTLDTDLKNAVAEIAELKTAVAGQQAALEALAGEGDMSEIAANIASVLSKVSELEKQVGDTGDKTIAEQIAALNKAVEELESKIGSSSNPEVNTLSVALAKALRSLVFQPSLYVDGIETIEYPYIKDTVIVEQPARTGLMRPARTTTGFVDGGKPIVEANHANAKLAKLRDWAHRTPLQQNDTAYFGPTWPVTYHMNPSKATTAWEDVQGWNVRQAEIITRSEAAAAGNIKVSNVWADGTELFSNANGILTVGLTVTTPQKLAHHAYPTEEIGRPGKPLEDETTKKLNGQQATDYYDDIIALQVKSAEGDEDTKLVTSDYAMIYPEKVWPEAIIWNKKPNKIGKTSINFDEKCPYDGTVHVWTNPYDALGLNDATVYPDIELQWDSEEGIRLGDYLGIHYVRDCKTHNKAVPGTWAYGEEAKWGYHYEFQRVGYSIDGNITIDSNYALFKDEDDKGVSLGGVIEAWNVDHEGNTINSKSQASVGREPLVRVFVKRGDRVILDGYILIHITRKADDTIVITDEVVYPKGSLAFDLCNGGNVLETNWSQFSKWVLTDKLDGMTKEEFDETYGAKLDGNEYAGVPDLKTATTSPIAGSDGYIYEDVQLYSDTKGTKADMTKHPGTVRYFRNNDATTNHKFFWYMTAEDLEYHTHDKAASPETVSMYIRYTKRNASNKPDFVYIKLETDLSRAQIATSGVTEKNINYWFAYTGADDGFDAIFFNPQFPADGGLSFQYPTQGTKNVFNNDIYNTFVGNKVNFTSGFSAYNALAYNNNARNNTAKFYFAPVNTEITAQDGTTYVITARKNYKDEKWNAFVCKYNVDQIPAGKTKYQIHKWDNDPAKNQETLNKCAIDYTDGVFTNEILYAVNKNNYGKSSYTADYTPIATLDQNITTGHVELTFRDPDNDITKEVLNAIGYEENHTNVLKELHTMVGVVAQNGCNVAIYVNEYAEGADNKNAGTFWTSWNRPINVDTNEKGLQDAKNNGDYIYLVDMMKLYDWRGPVDGKMYDAFQWLWAYYNLKSVTIDVTAEKVKTNMHHPELGDDFSKWPTLSSVTTRARLRTMAGTMTQTIELAPQMPNPYPTYYNAADKNADLKRDLGIDPVDETIKAKFGGVYYENNGEHVEDFDLIVPIQVNYGWGRFISEVRVKVHRTLGN